MYGARTLAVLVLVLGGCGSSTPGASDAADGVGNPDSADGVGVPDVRGDGPGVDGPDIDGPEEALPGDAPAPDISALMEEGTYWLANGEPGIAFDLFLQAVTLSPGNQEALFAAGLARYIHSVEFFGMLISLPSQFAGYGAGTGATLKPQSQNDLLVEQLHAVFMALQSGFDEADGLLAQVTSPEMSFQVEDAPIYVLTRPVMNFHGRFDIADVYLLRSSTAFFLWFLELLAAQDLHTDLLTGLYEGMALSEKGDIAVFDVLKLVSGMMAADERFFNLLPGEGEELFASGAGHVRDTGAFLLEGIALLEDLGEGEAVEAISVSYADGNTSILVRNRVDYESGEESEVLFDFSPEVLGLASDLVDVMAAGGDAVPFAEGPAVQLGVLAGFATRLDLLRLLPVDIPIDLSNVGPGGAAALVGMLLGNSIAFDYGQLLGHPVGLRVFFPLLTRVPDPVAAGDFWMEWECPAETAATGFPSAAGGFVCSKDAELADAAHFVGTDHEIPADGLASPLPYFVWEDPTWGGILKVDQLYLEKQGKPSDFVTPDLMLTNLGVHLWLKPIAGLLQ